MKGPSPYLTAIAAAAAIVPLSFALTDPAPNPEVHPKRAAQIQTILSTPDVLWHAAPHPRFAASAPGASAPLLGVRDDDPLSSVQHLVSIGAIVDLSTSAHSSDADGEIPIPASFDSATHWPHCADLISDVRDQSNCGCCWAFAGAEAASDRMCIATNGTVAVPLSAHDVCFNVKTGISNGCNGGPITSPWVYLQRDGGGGAVTGGQFNGTGPLGTGFCSDWKMPHCHHHGPQGEDPYPAEGEVGCKSEHTMEGPKACDETAVDPHHEFGNDRHYFDGEIVTARGEVGIQRAIMAGGPMEVAFRVYEDFENYAGGIYYHITGGLAGGHAVKLVGWGEEDGEKYWDVVNSWNQYWGEKGHFRIRRGVNECNIENEALASSHSSKWRRAGGDVGAGGSDGNPMGYGLKGSLQ